MAVKALVEGGVDLYAAMRAAAENDPALHGAVWAEVKRVVPGADYLGCERVRRLARKDVLTVLRVAHKPRGSDSDDG